MVKSVLSSVKKVDCKVNVVRTRCETNASWEPERTNCIVSRQVDTQCRPIDCWRMDRCLLGCDFSSIRFEAVVLLITSANGALSIRPEGCPAPPLLRLFGVLFELEIEVMDLCTLRRPNMLTLSKAGLSIDLTGHLRSICPGPLPWLCQSDWNRFLPAQRHRQSEIFIWWTDSTDAASIPADLEDKRHPTEAAFQFFFSLNNPIRGDGRDLTGSGHFRSSGGPDVTLLASAKENWNDFFLRLSLATWLALPLVFHWS